MPSSYNKYTHVLQSTLKKEYRMKDATIGILPNNLYDLLGSDLGITGKIKTEWDDLLTESATKVTDALSDSGIEMRAISIPSNSGGREGNKNSLGLYTCGIVAKHGNTACVYTWTLAESRDLTELQHRTGYDPVTNKSYTIPILPTDVWNDAYKKIVSNVVHTWCPKSTNLFILDKKTVYRDTVATTEELITDGIETVISQLLIKSGTVKDVTLNDFARLDEHGNPTATYGFNINRRPNGSYLDENGLPRPSSLVGQLSMYSDDQASYDPDEINGGSDNHVLSTIHLSMNIVYSNGEFTDNPLTKEAVDPSCFSPMWVIDELLVANKTPCNFYAMLGLLNQLYDEGITRTALPPEVIGALNVRVNLEGVDDPEPIPVEDMIENYDELFPAFLNNSVKIGILDRPGSAMSVATSAFRASSTSQKAYDDMWNGMLHLTGGLIAKYYRYGEPFVEYIERVIVGTYTGEDGETRPTSEVGLLQILNHYPDNPDMMKEWVASANPATDPDVSYGMKKSILETYTRSTMTEIDKGYLLTVNSSLIKAIGRCLAEHRVSISSNIDEYALVKKQAWVPYGGGVSGSNMRRTSGSIDDANIQGFRDNAFSY